MAADMIQLVDQGVMLRQQCAGIFADLATRERLLATMPEVHRATLALGRSATQYRGKALGLLMLGRGPYAIVRQCLSKIEHSRQALREAYYRHARAALDIEKLKQDLATLEPETLQGRRLALDLDEKQSTLAEQAVYIEGAMKEIAQYQTIYQQVCDKFKLRQDWDEMDMERAEAENHLKQAFLTALRSYISNGRCGMGECEYLENVGVHPVQGLQEVMLYATEAAKSAEAGQQILTTVDLDAWLSDMAVKYAAAPERMLRSYGIEPVDDWYIYKTRQKEGGSKNGSC